MKQFPSIYKVAAHTDNVGPGSTFVAIKGLTGNGVQYIMQALEKGATTLVVAHNEKLPAIPEHVKIIRVDCPRKALAQLSAQAYDNPAQKLRILGVTGTKGKTTSVYLMRFLLEQAGYKVALLSTIENSIGTDTVRASMTTAQPDYLHVFFDRCVHERVDYVIMEVAAQATTFSRLEGIKFAGLVFTNLDREHAELYPTMDEYFEAKRAIFDYADTQAVLVTNGDDLYGKKLGDYYSHIYSIGLDATQCSDPFVWQEGVLTIQQTTYTYSNLPGMFNAYNLAGVITLLKHCGIILPVCLGAFPAIAGRLQKIELTNGACAYIDYAHTPGSFKSLFATVRPWTNNLIVVFGAGGGKDHTKRAVMGSIAQEYADIIILTDDNPRFEDPEKIIQDILSGITNKQKVFIEHDRKTALEKAVFLSTQESIILLLGKGPDEYQIIKDAKIPFSEKAILQQFSR